MFGHGMAFVVDKVPGEPWVKEQRRTEWLDDRRPNVTAEVHNSHSIHPGKSGRAAEADQPKSAAKAGFSKIHNFDRPLSKPDIDQLVTPWRATVRKGGLQRGLDDEVRESPCIYDATPTVQADWQNDVRTVKDLQAFWGRSTLVQAKNVGSKHCLSKVEAQAALQRHITSGNKVDWNEVRNLRKIIAESD